MKNTKKSISYKFQNLYLATLAFLIVLNPIHAQDLQTVLEQATKDLANPIYAIIEMPQPDGSIQRVEIKKTELDKINLLETNYQLIRSEILPINERVFYKKSKNIKEKYLEVTLENNCKLDSRLVMVQDIYNKVFATPVKCCEKANIKRIKRTKTVTIPAQYKTISDTIITKATKDYKSHPYITKYETVTETVEVKPATTRWVRRKEVPGLYCCLGDCEIWVMVEVPARYETITRIAMTEKPPCTKKIKTAPEWAIIVKRVIIAPETTKEITEYMTIIDSILPQPDMTKTLQVPAKYKKVIQTAFKDSTKVTRLEAPLGYELENSSYINIQTTDIIQHYRPKSTNISIFPNPTTDEITVQSEDNIEQIQIFDAQGRVVFSHFYKNKNAIQLEISDFNNGFYSIQVKTNVTLHSSKILKQ